MTSDNQRAISDLLRSADKSIKSGDLDAALKSIGKVFEFDPRNVYARAYQERILSLKEAKMSSKARSEKLSSEQASQRPPEPARRQPASPKPPDAPAPAQPPAPPAESAQLPVTLEVPVQPSAPQFDFVRHTPALLEAYKTLLGEIWADGKITESEAERVASMRESFGISDDEHTETEREVRFNAYLSAIEEAWKKGVTDFEDLRKLYLITDQEHLQIEGRVFRLIQSLRALGTVLLVDDDAQFLDLACRMMTDSGYYCVAVPTCEEALKTLDSLTPDIVVCDVNFSKPNMSGFAFYEKFRSVDKYFHVPFLFLSGMAQEAVQRTGMQMGADGYFMKPVDLELFLATIEGKIKRARELQQRLSPHRL